ncbi:MAG TPA: hypothetical protein VF173_30050 [Thermoanaerobaculia bacterium]|nr:hypothetical protein [Thermoanaerobaculia bacterium]
MSVLSTGRGSNRTWLLQKQYEEINTNFRTAWDLYIKFYTVFLTFNVAALAALFSNNFALAEKSKWLVIGAFVLQDLLCAATSGLMAKFSQHSAEKLEQARTELLKDSAEHGDGIHAGSLPINLGRWAGWANCGAMLAMVVLWFGASLMKSGTH